MKQEVEKIIAESKKHGWVLEPLAKKLMQLYNLHTTEYIWAKTESEALKGAQVVGYPLVAKIVSPAIVHKSEVNGVVVGVHDDKELIEIYNRFSRLEDFAGILLDKMERGVEIIIGSKNDPQFGTVVLIGIGGTSVEIYKDASIRLAPLSKEDAQRAIISLKGVKLLQGFRGKEPINMKKLEELLVQFSVMAYELRDHITSIDLNPVLCNADASIIADARIILR